MINLQGWATSGQVAMLLTTGPLSQQGNARAGGSIAERSLRLETAAPHKITFDDLSLHQASFEIRYSEALPLWDRSGVMWTEIVRSRPDLKLRHADPSKVTFAVAGSEDTPQEIQVTVELARSIVTGVALILDIWP
jgi:hypothetical protein